MRTTLSIDDDVLEVAKAIAEARRISVGSALSELARRGYRSSTPFEKENGFAVFQVPDGAPPIDPERVREAAEDDAALHGRHFR